MYEFMNYMFVCLVSSQPPSTASIRVPTASTNLIKALCKHAQV